MARSAPFASALAVLSLLVSATPTKSAERDVVSRDLKLLRAPGKVEAAIWTRRAEGYTLQVVLKFSLTGFCSGV